MAIIGGRVGQKKDQNFTHRVVIEGEDGEKQILQFFTIRHARNYLREHPTANVIELAEIKGGRRLSLDPGAP